MDRHRALRLSVVDENAPSPRVTDEDGVGEWAWRPGTGAHRDAHTPLHLLQSPNLVASLRTPHSRAEAVMETMQHPLPPPKASAFHDDYHSVYVPRHPSGLRGVLALLQSPSLLLAIGLFAAVVGLFIDFWLAQIAAYHNRLLDAGFKYFAVSALACAGFSTALVHLVCPQAAGSGLPYMKVAISGVDMSDYLSLRCVVTKIVGLLAAYAAGLSIGKEGPFIMISCGFASVLLNLPLFQRINHDETKRLEMLACACAAGVAATFGSPFGGVLFGVEVTSHFYMVRTLPRSFFAAIVGALLVNFVTSNTRYGLFGSSSMGISDVGDLHAFSTTDLAVFVAIGVACGLGGAAFNAAIAVLVRLRDRFLLADAAATTTTLWTGLAKRLLLVAAVTLVSCLTEFYGDSAWFIRHGSPHRIIAALFSKERSPFDGDSSALLSRSLVTYLPLKFLLTLLSVVLPVPAGLFTPTFIIGGIFGRLVGEAVRAFTLLETQYEPFEFAIIGAGAFSSGVTHAISTAVIIMEISHSDGLNLPVSVAILAAYFTAKRFSDNVYDVLISTSKLPRLQKLPKAAYDIPSWEVMRDVADMSVLTADSTYADALHVLRRSPREPVFPIVDNRDHRFLLATVTRRRLQDAVAYCQAKMKANETSTYANATERTPLAAAAAHLGLHVNLLDWPIHFAVRRGGRIMDWGTDESCARTKLTVLINPSPFQLMEMTPMKRVDLLFRMLKLNNAYITRSGRLVGVITRDRLMTFLGTTSKYRLPGLCNMLAGCCADAVDKTRRRRSTAAGGLL